MFCVFKASVTSSRTVTLAALLKCVLKISNCTQPGIQWDFMAGIDSSLSMKKTS